MIARPAVWLATVNSALSPFVYFAFNRDYRNRCLQIFEIHSQNTKVLTAYSATMRFRNGVTVTPITTQR